MEKKEYPKDIGAVWVKESSYGEYLSIQVEINGVKYNFTAFPNKFYEIGGKKPQYSIKPPREQNQAVDKYEAQLASVMAQKESIAKQKALDKSASYNQPATFGEEDIPF